MEVNTALGHEWMTLQNNYERYEGGSLWIKLGAVLVFLGATAVALEPWLVAVVLLVLWLQEGIFRTFQARLGQRLLRLEQLLGAGAPAQGQPFQLHSAWLAQRRGTVGLLAEYAASACRPTVAFPYVVLLLLVLAQLLRR